MVDLLSSQSMIAFGEAVLGRKLDRKGGQQVLRYGHGDYSGPHTDHTPEIKRAAKGYLDFHLSLVGLGVAHQYLVYAKGGHFTEMVPVAESGCLTLYRLPFWHYTTPLRAKPKQEHEGGALGAAGDILVRGPALAATSPVMVGLGPSAQTFVGGAMPRVSLGNTAASHTNSWMVVPSATMRSGGLEDAIPGTANRCDALLSLIFWNDPMDRLDAMRVFVAVADAGSLSGRGARTESAVANRQPQAGAAGGASGRQPDRAHHAQVRAD